MTNPPISAPPYARTRSSRGSVNRLALETLLACIVVGAAAGIYSVVAGGSDELAVKVLVTTLAVGCACVLSLPAAYARLRGRLGAWPWVGIVTAAVGCAMVSLGAWFEIEADGYWKLSGTLIVASAAVAHLCLVTAARLAASHRWIIAVAVASAFTLAALLCVAILAESGSDGLWRSIAVLGITTVATSALVPVFHRMSRVAAPSTPVRFCPGCGKQLTAQLGDVACNACGARFHIAVAAAPATAAGMAG